MLNIVDLADVYDLLPARAGAGRVALGQDVRIILDAAPQYVIPAAVSFVASTAQFTPKTVETASERQKLMFRVKAQISPELLHAPATGQDRPARRGLDRWTPARSGPPNLKFGCPDGHATRRPSASLPRHISAGPTDVDDGDRIHRCPCCPVARAAQDGRVTVLGGDMADRRHRDAVCPRIAYMPQGLGKNLYPTLSVEENLQFFGRLFGHDAASGAGASTA